MKHKETSRSHDPLLENIKKIEEFTRKKTVVRSKTQILIESVYIFFASSNFLIYLLAASFLWIICDITFFFIKHRYFDEPPFPALQGIWTLTGVLIAAAVLARQTRLAVAEEERAHLELQINLLAEQKATKIISLLEELRKDIPHVKNRVDEQAETLSSITNPDAVFEAVSRAKQEK